MEEIHRLLRKVRTRKGLGFLFIALLVLSFPYLLGTLNPGFEGAKAYFYGAYFPSSSWPGYTGTDTLHRYQDAESFLVKESHKIGLSEEGNIVSWTSLATPNDAGMGHEWYLKGYMGGENQGNKPDIKIHVESNLQLQDITRQGDPIGWNSTDPNDSRRIEYWQKKATKVSEVNDTANNQTIITYTYIYEKESFILTPVEFWVGYYLVPSQQNAYTGSGWREGEWKNIVLWFRLDFNTWDNAYKDAWLDDPQQNVFTSMYNGTIINQKKLDEYRGGFPICGWLQGWQKAGWTSQMTEDEDPVWATREGKSGHAKYTANQLGQLKNKLMAKVQFSPGMVGQFLSLYNTPDVKFEYKSDLTETDFSNDANLISKVKAPDSTMQKIMYFPMNIENFGTLAEGEWWNGWDIYYPEAYFRVRMIYGIYGTFQYLWTEQVTLPWKIVDPVTGEVTYPGGLDYPKTIETAGTTIIHTSGAGAWTAGITGFFSSPTGLLWTFFFVMVIIVIFVTVFNPGVWTALVALRSSRGGFKKGKGKGG